MPLRSTINTHGFSLSKDGSERIEHHLHSLEERLEHHPDPSATISVTLHAARRQYEADARLQLGPHGQHLVSRETAETPDQAARLAIEDLKRQLERKHAQQRGESSFGVPSRRLPRSSRPHPPEAQRSESEAAPEED